MTGGFWHVSCNKRVGATAKSTTRKRRGLTAGTMAGSGKVSGYNAFCGRCDWRPRSDVFDADMSNSRGLVRSWLVRRLDADKRWTEFVKEESCRGLSCVIVVRNHSHVAPPFATWWPKLIGDHLYNQVDNLMQVQLFRSLKFSPAE